MNKAMSYEEFLWRIKDDIRDSNGASPITPVLKFFQLRWRSEVLYYLFTSSSARFNEIKFNLTGITSTMLSSTLKDLIQFGLVCKSLSEENPQYAEYSLTEKGEELLPVYYEIMNWGFEYGSSLEKPLKK